MPKTNRPEPPGDTSGGMPAVTERQLAALAHFVDVALAWAEEHKEEIEADIRARKQATQTDAETAEDQQ